MAKKQRRERAPRVTLVNDKGTRITVAEALAPRMRGFRPVDQAVATGAALEGDPDESWTVAQLRGWAEDNDVDLDGATKKADILDVIAAAVEAGARDDEDEDEE